MEDRLLRNDEVLAEISSLEKKHGGVTAHMVLNSAKKDSSPLHDYFVWDDTKAADSFRVWQARQLIRSVKVTISGKKTQAFWNIKVNVGSEVTRAYFSIEKVLKNPDMYRQTLSKAVEELNYWQQKYEDLKDLKKVIDPKVLKKAEAKIKK